MSDTKLQVKLGERSYPIHIGVDMLEALPEILPKIGYAEPYFIITDSNVAQHHLTQLRRAISRTGVLYEIHTLPPGESTKSFDQYKALMDWLLSHKPTRHCTLIAFGGGVIGDLTGFAASSLLRGVNFIQIPTTLLAMVDSSVGGKTGINSEYGKNLIGAFYQPKLVLADVSTLCTLPKREMLAGYAEVVKYAFINDSALFDELEQHTQVWSRYETGTKDNALLELCQSVVEKSCKAKADIVAIDEREGGVRALLNLGHTFGHAIEAELGYDGRILHGEAVAIGMAMAFLFSVRLGVCDKEEASKAISHMQKAGLATDLAHIDYAFDAASLLRHMRGDKKNLQGKLVLILVKAIGEAYIEKDVDAGQVHEFIAHWLLDAKIGL